MAGRAPRIRSAASRTPTTVISSKRRLSATGTPSKRTKLALPQPHDHCSANADADSSPALSPSVTAQLERLTQERTATRGGWLLSEALDHLARDGSLVPLMNRHGLPGFYTECASEGAQSTYTALCRTIVGQQLAGAAVRKIWGRLVEQFPHESLTPAALLERAATNEGAGLEELRSTVGLSNAKARALVSLSQFYQEGRLSDALLLDSELSDTDIIARLTEVKGIGPWSAQMFLMFHLHKPDLLPLGDLGVRNGIRVHFLKCLHIIAN